MMQQQNQRWQQHSASQLQPMRGGPTTVDASSSAAMSAYMAAAAAQQRGGFMQRPQDGSQVMAGRPNGMHQYDTSLPMASAASGNGYSDMQGNMQGGMQGMQGGTTGQSVENEDDYHNAGTAQFWQQINSAQLANMSNRMASQMYLGQNHDGTLDLQGMQQHQQGTDGVTQFHPGMMMLPMAVNARGLPAVSMTSNGATGGYSFSNIPGMTQMQAMNNIQFQNMLPFATKFAPSMNAAQQSLNAMAKMPQSQHGGPVGGGARDNDPDSWQAGLIAACRNALYRLKFRANAKKRSDLMEHIKNGPLRAPGNRPCLIVARANQDSRSPFQVTVRGNRILAQKAIYAGYNRLSANDLGTWAVQQTCRHSDGSWWCFEPSHLEKCPRDHLPAWVVRLPANGPADAIFVARARRQQNKKLAESGPKTPKGKTSASSPKSPGMPDPGPAVDHVAMGMSVATSVPMSQPTVALTQSMPIVAETSMPASAPSVSTESTSSLAIPENRDINEKISQPANGLSSASALNGMVPVSMVPASMMSTAPSSGMMTHLPSNEQSQ